jgi:hypothetical protein
VPPSPALVADTDAAESKIYDKSLDAGSISVCVEPIANWFEPLSASMPSDEPTGNSNYALERLRSLLRSGTLEADGRLPTERELSTTLGVSRRAVRRALEVLEAEGRVWRRQGSGTYAGPLPDMLS